MDDQMRRMLDSFNAISDQTRSVFDSLRSADLPAQQAALALVGWDDRNYAARAAFDSLERVRLEDTFAGAYQSSSLAMMKDVLASFEDARYPGDYFVDKIYKGVVDGLGYGVTDQLGASKFALHDSYSRLADLQKSVAEQFAGAIPRLEVFFPCLALNHNGLGRLKSLRPWSRCGCLPQSRKFLSTRFGVCARY
jgi:hypothetical protein